MTRLPIDRQTPPVVEIDSEANAAYVRFRGDAVVRAVPVHNDGVFVSVDLDANGSVIGLEVVGAHNLAVCELLTYAPVELSREELLSKTQYVAVRVGG